ncbi:MAG: hypothetical protein CFE24_12965 [Flavobacterium sp. BFFFF2]|nr:MAG: hypothetical protein CFE24_12965 [Flavobacterium sp. BFFFF2]
MLFSNRKYQKKVTNINEIYFINSENEKITVFSPYPKILLELKKLDIETRNVTLEELISKLCLMLVNEYERIMDAEEDYEMSEFRTTEFYKKITVLLNHVKEVSYNLYGYNEHKMPSLIKEFYIRKLDNLQHKPSGE